MKMPAISKKQKINHGSSTPGTPAVKHHAAGSPNEDPRFQMNSDFTDSDGEEHHVKFPRAAAGVKGQRRRSCSTPAGNGAAPTPQPASQATQRGVSTPLTLESMSGEDGHGDDDGDDLGDGSDGDLGGDGGAGADGDGGSAPNSNEDQEDDDHGSVRGDGSESGDGDLNESTKPIKPKKVLSKRTLEQVKEASDRRGIVYISRIPPHMKPHKLRQLLEPFGDIGRVYCAPEDPALRRMRKKKGGNSGKNFTEGWVEFEDKRRAKRAALALNGQPMGGSKRSAYHYDLWTIKYLPKFKWDTLTEEINYQRAVREQRLVAEISAAKRERDFYLSRVDKAKAIGAIQERRRTKQPQPDGGGGDSVQPSATAADVAPPAAAADRGGGGGARLERHFGQRQAKADPVLDERAPVLADDVLGLLGRKRKAQK